MTRTGRRPGFTLVELLVAVALMILLAALTVAVANTGIIDSQRVVGAADRASGWLLIAKQRAKRDGAPRGVRFFVNSTTDPLVPPNAGGMVTQAQYIESPDPWVPNPGMASNPTGARIVFENVVGNPNNANGQHYQQISQQRVFFVSGGTAAAAQADLNEFDSRVTVGDYLALPEFGTSYRITKIVDPQTAGRVTVAGVTGGANPVLTTTHARELWLNLTDSTQTPTTFITTPSPLGLNSYFTYPDLGAANSSANTTPQNSHAGTYVTYQFAFQAAPRPLLGEPTLQLTGSTVIDFQANSATPANPPKTVPPTTTGVSPVTDTGGNPLYFDILFSPTGQVLYNSNPLIALWVRNPDKVLNPRYDATSNAVDQQAQYDAAGDQALIVVSPRSGLIATQPVAPPKLAPGDPYQFARDGLNTGL